MLGVGWREKVERQRPILRIGHRQDATERPCLWVQAPLSRVWISPANLRECLVTAMRVCYDTTYQDCLIPFSLLKNRAQLRGIAAVHQYDRSQQLPSRPNPGSPPFFLTVISVSEDLTRVDHPYLGRPSIRHIHLSCTLETPACAVCNKDGNVA